MTAEMENAIADRCLTDLRSGRIHCDVVGAGAVLLRRLSERGRGHALSVATGHSFDLDRCPPPLGTSHPPTSTVPV